MVKLRLVLEYFCFLLLCPFDANSGDADQAPHYASPDLHLHFLTGFLMEPFRFTLVNLGLYYSIYIYVLQHYAESTVITRSRQWRRGRAPHRDSDLLLHCLTMPMIEPYSYVENLTYISACGFILKVLHWFKASSGDADQALHLATSIYVYIVLPGSW